MLPQNAEVSCRRRSSTPNYSKGAMNMEDKTLPFYAHEGIIARMERANRRLWILCIILVLLLAGTNGAWVYYESQFVDETLTVTQDTKDGYNNYIGNDGDITNGTADSDP